MTPLRLVNGRSTSAVEDMPSSRYEPIALLSRAEGHCAYRVWDTKLRQNVLLLLGDPACSDHLDPVDFLALTQSLGRSCTPGLPAIFQYGFHGERPFVAREQLEGRPLNELPVQERGPAVAVAVGLQVARGLRGLHAIGRGHGNVDLPNILVREDGQVVLADAGIVTAWTAPRDEQPHAADDILRLGRCLLLIGSGPATGAMEEADRTTLWGLVSSMTAADVGNRPTVDVIDEVLCKLAQPLARGAADYVPALGAIRLRPLTEARLPQFNSSASLAFVPPPLAATDDLSALTGKLTALTRNETGALEGFSLEPEVYQAGRLAGFINTISVCSARWFVGKEHGTWLPVLGLKTPPPAPLVPPEVIREIRVFQRPLLLGLCLVSLMLYFDQQEQPPLPEPQLIAIAQLDESVEREPPMERPRRSSLRPDEDERHGEPRVIRLRDGVMVFGGEETEPDWDRLTPRYRQPKRPIASR